MSDKDQEPTVLVDLAKEKISEYLLVSDINSKVILSSTDYKAVRKQASMIRQAGGAVTVFKSLEA